MKSKTEFGSIFRRDFFKLFAGIGGALGVPSLWSRLAHAEEVPQATGNSPDESYLEQGLNALARAHYMSSMAGHLGAALIAGYFIGKQRQNLDPDVCRGIQSDLQRVVSGESVFGKQMSKDSKLTDSELFEPFPKQTPDATLIDGIAEGLEKGIDKPRQSGHNVIFASLAIRALKEHPEFATPAVVDGIIRLMTLFANETPGSGYYGKKRGRIHGDKISLSDDEGAPAYDDIESMALTVFDEMLNMNPEVNRVGYGGLVHVINHAAAIADLADYGYGALVPRAIRSHLHHLRLWRDLPNVAAEKGPLQVSTYTPHMAAYWTSGNIPYDRALLTHRAKTMFAFDELAAAVDADAKEKAAYEKLRYLM